MTQPVQEPTDTRTLSGVEYRTRQLARRPTLSAPGVAIFEIKVDEDNVVVTARDKAFAFDIPSELDEAVLIDCEAWITTESASGTVVVSLWNETQGHDMLSTPLQIDIGELNDKDSGTPFVINLANDDVAYGDEIWINVDNAGSGAMGLGVAVKFTPSDNAAIVVRGAKGDPGGVTEFQGAWQNTTDYQAGDVVTHNGVIYIALQDHTSNAANDEPGVGTNWEDFWAEAFTIPMTSGWNATFSSSSGAIPEGIKGAAIMPFDGTITAVTLLADVAGDAEVDIWVSDYAGYPPNSGNSITGGTPPTLIGSIKNFDSTLSGWTTALNEGDILVFYVSGVSIARRLTLGIRMDK